MKTAFGVLARVVVVASVMIAGAHARAGGGDVSDLPPRRVANLDVWPAPELEPVAEISEPPGRLTITPQGKVIVTLHHRWNPRWSVVSVTSEGKASAFPSEAWHAPAKEGEASKARLDTVTAVRSDPRGIVWMLDAGTRGKSTPKLVAWDTRVDRLHQLVYLPPPVTLPDSFLADLAVDTSNNAIYIADPSSGEDAAIIVVELATGDARRVLAGHASVRPEKVDLVIDGNKAAAVGRDEKTDGAPVGVTPITLDMPNTWLYFGAMHAKSLYRVKTQDILNASLSTEQLAKKVERYCDKPACDGITKDSAGNIYLGDIANHAVGFIDAKKTYRVLMKDEKKLAWPSAFSFGNDGLLNVASNPLRRGPVERGDAKQVFYVTKFRAIAGGLIGR